MFIDDAVRVFFVSTPRIPPSPFFHSSDPQMRDGRITLVGKVLRATGLDEVPPFINILAGAMSPLDLASHRGRLSRLGLTGIAIRLSVGRESHGYSGLAQLIAALPPTLR